MGGLGGRIRGVLFDMAGTTVEEAAAGSSAVEAAFLAAFAQEGIDLDRAALRRQRGMEKRAAIGRLAPSGASGELVERVYGAFLQKLEAAVAGMRAKEGAESLFGRLRAGGIAVGLGSGFPQATVDALVRRLGWNGRVDYVGSAEMIGAGRPDPAMVLDFMKACALDDPQTVLKVGDTAADIAEGRNAGVVTAGVLGGAHGRAALGAAGADYIVEDLAALGRLLPI